MVIYFGLCCRAVTPSLQYYEVFLRITYYSQAQTSRVCSVLYTLGNLDTALIPQKLSFTFSCCQFIVEAVQHIAGRLIVQSASRV